MVKPRGVQDVSASGRGGSGRKTNVGLPKGSRGGDGGVNKSCKVYFLRLCPHPPYSTRTLYRRSQRDLLGRVFRFIDFK